MIGLEAHYSARDIEARILAAIRAAGLNPGYACRRKRWGRLTISTRADTPRVTRVGQIRLVRGVFLMN
jgi:hypothetical protein